MKRLLPLAALLAMVLPLCSNPSKADVAATPQPFSTTAASGTLGPWPCANANSVTVTVTSAGSSTITLKQATDSIFSAAYTAVSSFGTSGSVTPSANTQYSGTLAGVAVLYVEITYTGNTGTLSGTMTCSATVPSPAPAGSGGGSSTVTCASPGCVIASLPPPVQPSPLYTSPVHDAAPVQPSPLYTQPVHDAAPVQPSPLYTQPVSTINPSLPAPQVTWPVSTINPSLPAPQVTWPVTTPAPLASQSPVPFPAFAHLHVGSGTNLYLDTWADTWVTTSSINSATTTLIVTGVASQTMYVFFAGFEMTGTNSAVTANLEYGQGATCGTNTVQIFPANIPGTGIASGAQITLYSGANNVAAGSSPGLVPATVPLVIPANATAYNLCGVTAGTTILGKFFAYYAIHSN